MMMFKRNRKAIALVAGLAVLVFLLACSGESAAQPSDSTGNAATGSGVSRPTFTPVPTATATAAAVTTTAKAAVAATSTPLPTPTPEQPTDDSAAVVESSLIQLADPLDEPEFYCVDVPGFRDSLRADRPLQAHTCKPGADDELFSFNRPAAGQLYMEAYDLCVEAEGDLAYTRNCTAAAAQRFTHTSNGEIRTETGDMCLAVASGSGEPAGGQSHVRRNLRLTPCAEVEPSRSRWLFPGASPKSQADAVAEADRKLMYAALESAQEGEPWAIEKIGDSSDPKYIPVLVELLRFPWWHIERAVDEAIYSSLDRIAAQNPGIEEINAAPPRDEWFQWVIWLGKHPEIMPPEGFAGWKGELFANLVDPAMGAFLYDGVKANIRVEEIVWGGVRKDGIPDLTNAPVIAGEYASYLDPEDRVFGVSFNGEHRAYPHRIINAHEMANDVVGGVPFALAY